MSFQKITAVSTWATLACALIALPGLAAAQSDRNGGSRIAFIQGPDVYTMKPDGTDVLQLTNLGPDTFAFWLAWSFDAKRLAFQEYPPNAPPQIWVMNSDGSNQHLLFKDTDGDWSPSFSPDGTEVIFMRQSSTGQQAIYRVGIDGTGLAAITPFDQPANDFGPVYSPDGSSIAFESYDRDGFLGAVYLMNPDGSDIHRITPIELGAVRPSWSPDGQNIAFYTHCCNSQNNEIWTVERDGRQLTRLTGSDASDLDIPVAHYNQFPSWSPRGNKIVFGQYLPSSNTSAIFITNDDGSECRQIKTLPLSLRKMDDPAWKKRHHVPHEIENGGGDPRWSPPQW